MIDRLWKNRFVQGVGRVIAVGATLLLLTNPAGAATLSFGAATNVGAGTGSLATPGNQVVIQAVDVNGAGGTTGGVTFTAGSPGTTGQSGGYAGANPANLTGNATFDSILDTATFFGPGMAPPAPGTGDLITLTGLTVGAQYTIQLFSVDNRLGSAGGSTIFDSNLAGGGDDSALVNYNTGQFIIGTFTADAATQTVRAFSGGGGFDSGIINAFVLRQIVPEVNAANCAMPIALIGLVLLALVDRRKRLSGTPLC